MEERRAARRYEISLPLEIGIMDKRPVEFCRGQLRNISRSGVYFLSNVEFLPGTSLELSFSLPTERERRFAVLVQARAQTLRVAPLRGEITPLYGVGALLYHINFVRQVAEKTA